MKRKKSLKDFEREAQNKADTFQKKVYLFKQNGTYRITFKMPVIECKEFAPNYV